MGFGLWYIVFVAEPSPPDVVFEGNSLSVIRSFPAEVRENLGADLRRLQNGERPLDSASMAPALPGIFELRDQGKATWYRVLYIKTGGVVYVLHCFTKKTNQTPKGDIEVGRKRLGHLKARLAKQKK
jgi:phage-related protein